MEDKVQDLLSSCSEIDFGAVNLIDREKKFYRELNNEIILLCKSLPESIQTDALLFFMRYSRTSFREEFDFFRFAYVPTWSVIYWLIQCVPDDKVLEKEDIKNVKIAHSMAVFLHYLDHQLNDHDMTVTHLALLLRSQLWIIMNNAFNSLADRVDGGKKIVQGFIDDYYSAIYTSEKIDSLDSYCNLFRKQMATGFIAPALLTKMITSDEEFAMAIKTAFGSFGIAWRLLDDLQDIESDMMESAKSSIYACLPENTKNYWDKLTEDQLDKKNDYARIILDCIVETRVIDRIKERICSELESAASIADYYEITGLADEFRCLLKPLKNRQDRV